MNKPSYRAIRSAKGAAFMAIRRGYIEATGRDCLAFLQGQVSNDVLSLSAGDSRHACLLNNTGHLLADLRIYALADRCLIETDVERVALVVQTLEHYVIRERVTFRDVSADLGVITVQGAGSSDMLDVVGVRVSESQSVVESKDYDGNDLLVMRRDRTGAGGYDIVVSAAVLDEVQHTLLYSEFAQVMDAESLDVARIESQIPAWGRELDETVIPLEAELDDAISYDKGCYVGQEIIARIHARGHVNKALRLIRFDRSVDAGAIINAIAGSRAGEKIGRITSCTNSPKLGNIALGYVHRDYASPDAEVAVGDHRGVVLALPQRAAEV